MKEIPLTQGKVALIDDEDYDRLSQWKWYFGGRGYAVRGVNPKICMHRVILGASEGEEVDHINGDRLDNRKSNLRLVTKCQNSQNRRARGGKYSGYKGITWNKSARKWQVMIRVDKKSIYIGLFHTEESAARAYDASAREHFGIYARCNFEQELV